MINYTISNNKELSQAVEDTITDNGTKKTWLAAQLGIANQNVNKIITKKNISLDDANKILNLMGYKATIIIEKQQEDIIMEKGNSMREYKDMSDFELANHYFNYLQYNGIEEEKEQFSTEVNKRRGQMLPSEWLNYNY